MGKAAVWAAVVFLGFLYLGLAYEQAREASVLHLQLDECKQRLERLEQGGPKEIADR